MGIDDLNNADTRSALNDRPWFGGVSESRRREEIVSLVEERGDATPYTVGELTVTLSGWFREETDGMVPTDEEIHSVLYEFDLPRLDADGRLLFDRETGRVYTTETSSSREQNVVRHSNDGLLSRERISRFAGLGMDVSRDAIVSLGVVFVGVVGVAVTLLGVGPLPIRYVLVPPTVVVLFFGYRSVRRL